MISFSLSLCLTSCDRLHHLRLIQVISRKLAHDMPVSHDDETAAGAEHLLNLRRDECDAHTLFREFQHQFLDFQLGTYIDASRGLVQDQVIRMREKPSRQNYLLLVSAAERTDWRLPARGLDVQDLH